MTQYWKARDGEIPRTCYPASPAKSGVQGSARDHFSKMRERVVGWLKAAATEPEPEIDFTYPHGGRGELIPESYSLTTRSV